MKIDVFGVEEKSFKDKKDGSVVVYYRAYGFKSTNREKVVGGLYCEIKINKECYESLIHYLNDSDGLIYVDFNFDENGRVIDWVVL